MTFDEYQKLRDDRPDLRLPMLAPETVESGPYQRISIADFEVIRCHQLLIDWIDVDPLTGCMPVVLSCWLDEHPEYDTQKVESA